MTNDPEPIPQLESVAGAPRRRVDPAILLVLLASAALLLHAAWVVGPTYDEHFYVATGISYLTDGDYSLNREHPPLLKLLAGVVPWLVGGFGFPQDPGTAFNLPGAFFYQAAGDRWPLLLFLGRLPLCLLTLVGEVVFYVATRRWFGRVPAIVATAALAFDPNVIAHGSLAALDMGTATLMTVALFAWISALRRPSPGARLGAGVAMGLACATKFTALVLWPVLLVSAVATAAAARSLRPLATLAIVVAVSLGAFSATYGFEARSVASVRLHPEFAEEVDPPPMTAGAFVERVGSRVDESTFRARLFDTGVAQGARNALEVWLLGAAEPRRGDSTPLVAPVAPEERLAIVRALGALTDAPGEVRKRAFEVVLAEDELPEQERDRILGDLARVDLAERGGDPIEAWREFYARNRTASWDVVVFRTGWIDGLVRTLFGDHRPVPLLVALKGLDRQLAHASTGHASYYRGEEIGVADESGSYPLYYLDVLVHKNPIGFVAAVLLGLVVALRRVGRWGRLEAALVVGTSALLLVTFALGNTLMGVRYVLPLLPLGAVLVGRAVAAFPRAATALVAVGVLESIWMHPHELMYFNLLAGGPDRGTYITVLGDDWGQDTAAFGRWCEEHREEIDRAGGMFFDPYIEADLVALGLERTMPVLRNVQGLVAVNAVSQRRWAQRYSWLEDHPVIARVGWTIRIYDTRPRR
ncbi:MAG: glycosyltransferase family 39 protein [Planctomycetota bacterium]